MATSKKKSTPPKETITNESASAKIDHGLNVAPTMPYYCTWLPGACPAETKAANAQTLLTMMPPMCPGPVAGPATIVPTFIPPCPTMPIVCVHTVNPVCPAPAAVQPHVKEEALTATIITCTGIPIVCGTVPQPQTIMPPTITVPPMCPAPTPQTVTGIPFVCNQGGPQPQTTVYPPHSHVPPFCPAGAQAQTILGPTAYPGCNTATTTVQPSFFTCPPTRPVQTATTTVQTGVGTPAQAQGTIGTISAFPPACLVTALAHCFTAATCAAPAQAQTVMPVTTLCFPPSIGCPPNAQAQTIVPTPTAHHTFFACPVPTPTATTTVQTGVGTPAQAQGTIGTISAFPPACLVTALAHCFTAATCAAPAQAQAQTIINPTTHPTANTMCFICPPPTVTGTIRAGGAQAQAVTILTAQPNCGGIQTNVAPCGPIQTNILPHCGGGINTNIYPVCNPIPTNFCPYTAQPGCGIHATRTATGTTVQPAMVAQTMATVCTQTGPVNTIHTINGCPRPTVQTQIGCVTQPPICFYTTITQPIGQCPPTGTGPQPQTIFPSLPTCVPTHPAATCPPLGTAQPQAITGVFCGITNTITATTITITV